jgi:branched-chain amino acid transport system permease protein
MIAGRLGRAAVLPATIVAALFALQFVVPAYHHLAIARIMVLATFATGYNLLFGYAGLLSLGHAMLFAAGLYGAGLTAYHLGFEAPAAFAAGLLVGAAFSFVVGIVVLRTVGVGFMIVTLMFAQAFHLATFYFGDYTRGDEGLTIPSARRAIRLFGVSLDLADPSLRYNLALFLLAAALAVVFIVVRGPVGRVLVAIRENESRTVLLGYDTARYKLFAFVLSGVLSAAAGGAYALLFGYVGSTFASIQYSIYPLLWTLLGGAGTLAGPLVGTLAMFYLVDVASSYTGAYLLVVGVALIMLVLFFPNGILGVLRRRWPAWLA